MGFGKRVCVGVVTIWFGRTMNQFATLAPLSARKHMICMVFLLFPRSIGTYIPQARKGALLPSRDIAALPREEVIGKGPGACVRGSPIPAGHGKRVLNAEPKGAAPAPKRCPIIVQTGDCANISNIYIAIGRSGATLLPTPNTYNCCSVKRKHSAHSCAEGIRQRE